MSATGRNVVGHERHPDDLYETPAWCVKSILPYVKLGEEPLDPCAGNGAILEAIRYSVAYPVGTIRYSVAYPVGKAPKPIGVEIDMERGMECMRRGFPCPIADALGPGCWPSNSGIIMNPPYKLALEFVDRAMRETEGQVVALLRLGFLESKARYEFHQKHRCDVYVLSKRPSFAHGKTDASAYAWFVWPALSTNTHILGERNTLGTIRVI